MVVLGSGMIKFISFANLKVQYVPTEVRGTYFILTDIMNKSGILISHLAIILTEEEYFNKMIWSCMTIYCVVTLAVSVYMLRFEDRDNKDL